MWRDTFLVQRGKMTRATWKNLSSKKKIPDAKKISKKNSRRRVNLCVKTKYKSPCKPGQSWECVRVAGRSRLRKCKNRVPPTAATVAKKCTCYRPKIPVIRPEQRTSKPRRLGDSTGWQDNSESIGKKRSVRMKAKGRRKSLSNRFNKELRRAALRYKHSKLHALKTSQREAFTNNLEYRLVKLNGKIAGMKLKLQQMRDRKKRLMRIRMQTSFQENFEPFPCECVPAKGTQNKAGKTRKKRQPKQEAEARSHMFRERNIMRNKKSKRGDGFKAQLEKMIKSRNAKKKGKKKRRKKCAKVGMTCFHHTENHWKTEPRWKQGEFCACTNAANNTYHCLRTINATHNFLYCEFVTDFLEYFDLNSDPYQLRNIVNTISRDVLKELHNLLEKMKGCKGSRECSHYYGRNYSSSREVIDPTQIPVILTTPTSPNVTSGSSLKTLVLYNVTTNESAVSTQSPIRRKNGTQRSQNPTETSASNSSKEPVERRQQKELTTPPPRIEKVPSYKVVTRPVKLRKRKKTRLNKKRKSKLRKKKVKGNKGSKKSKRKRHTLPTKPATQETQTVKPTES